MLWTRGLIGTVWQIKTTEPREELAPQPQKMWNNSAQKAAVSPVTSRATFLGIAQIDPWTIKPTNPLP